MVPGSSPEPAGALGTPGGITLAAAAPSIGARVSEGPEAEATGADVLSDSNELALVDTDGGVAGRTEVVVDGVVADGVVEDGVVVDGVVADADIAGDVELDDDWPATPSLTFSELTFPGAVSADPVDVVADGNAPFPKNNWPMPSGLSSTLPRSISRFRQPKTSGAR